MSEVIKKNKAKAAKILGAAVFVLMMLFSLQITTNPNSAGDIDLLGLKVSLASPSVFATTGGCEAEYECPSGGRVSCTGQKYCYIQYPCVKCDDVRACCNDWD